jgi:hypothetical protein
MEVSIENILLFEIIFFTCIFIGMIFYLVIDIFIYYYKEKLCNKWNNRKTKKRIVEKIIYGE